MNGVQDSDAFRRLIAALEPWLDQVVIVGGWAHQLYRMHPSAQELEYQPLGTLDADVAVPARLPAAEPDIRSRLLAHGFTEEFLGNDHPPATHYRLVGDGTGFYAEFLTPLIGSAYDRNKRRKATTEVSGVASQRLRYIELLLRARDVLFGELSDDIRRAAEISAERALSPEAIGAACHYGFAEVFVNF